MFCFKQVGVSGKLKPLPINVLFCGLSISIMSEPRDSNFVRRALDICTPLVPYQLLFSAFHDSESGPFPSTFTKSIHH
jgi:hypothetical protein